MSFWASSERSTYTQSFWLLSFFSIVKHLRFFNLKKNCLCSINSSLSVAQPVWDLSHTDRVSLHLFIAWNTYIWIISNSFKISELHFLTLCEAIKAIQFSLSSYSMLTVTEIYKLIGVDILIYKVNSLIGEDYLSIIQGFHGSPTFVTLFMTGLGILSLPVFFITNFFIIQFHIISHFYIT